MSTIPLKTLHPDDLLWVCAELTLLFHAELVWGDESKTKWHDRIAIIYRDQNLDHVDFTPTTRNLCDAIRVSMERIAKCYAAELQKFDEVYDIIKEQN